jgi:hypothetical protein
MRSSDRIGAALVLAGCASSPAPANPVVEPVADAALAAAPPAEAPEAATPPVDAGVADAGPAKPTVFSAKPFETCPTDDIDARSVVWLSTKLLSAEDRMVKLDDGSTKATRIARAKSNKGQEVLVIVGPLIATSGPDDDCHLRIDVYPRTGWRALGAGVVANIDGVDAGPLHAFLATGDADLSALLVATDDHGEPRAIDIVSGSNDVSTVEVFKGGLSYSVSVVESGDPIDATVSVHLIALGADGFTELLSVPSGSRSAYPCDPPSKSGAMCSVGPPGGFSVLARGDRPRLNVLSAASDECGDPTTNFKGCTVDASTMTYDPHARKFVADGPSKKKHVAPTRHRAP